MNKSALQDIQQALNAIRSEIERVDDETKWAALELMFGTSGVCQISCPPNSCGVSDFRGAVFAFWVQPDGSCGLPVAGLS
jgi:hypothetical protein